MDRDRLITSTKQHEGYRQLPYRDSVGKWTVGHGHLLEGSIIPGRLQTIDALLDHITDKAQHSIWFDADLDLAIERATAWLGRDAWDALTDVRREVVAEMAFQLGWRIRGFVRLRQAILDGDWGEAVVEMRDSRWHQQTTSRVEDLISKIA